ncbi:hypothetical protein BH10PSE13_BH10PSE13_10420 [soil metagenome]
MTSKTLRIAAALLGAATLAAPMSAHHSFAMFDPTKPMSFEGTVKTLQWTAPHAILWIDTGKVGNYAAGLWSLELPTSPGNLSKMGWSRTAVKPGDRVRVDINPIRDGRRSGQFKKLTFLDTGKVLTVGAIPGAQPPK